MAVVPQQAQKALDDGGFAGAVGSPKGHSLLRCHLEAEIVDGDETSKAFGQVFESDHFLP
jgi:hypothetical protein